MSDMAWAGSLEARRVVVTDFLPDSEMGYASGFVEGAARKAVRRRVLTAYWCRGTVQIDFDVDDTFIVQRSDERTIPRDRTHRDGWDRIDDGNTVELFGPSCFAVQDGRHSVRLLRPNARCL
jgi:hypothetical protein